jgi:hypothetical protein
VTGRAMDIITLRADDASVEVAPAERRGHALLARAWRRDTAVAATGGARPQRGVRGHGGLQVPIIEMLQSWLGKNMVPDGGK